jgi:hypothetical protein
LYPIYKKAGAEIFVWIWYNVNKVAIIQDSKGVRLTAHGGNRRNRQLYQDFYGRPMGMAGAPYGLHGRDPVKRRQTEKGGKERWK